ncbi:ATP-binding protein [Actinocorallia sp. A-T 12471]|uniref:AAA family ATPase n=1 Tax=Actinocorallia sp. A-T 12471 TaxID=3089813 RepID=UPI0029D1261E|nr:ATP-binding protein [Actinocorallia sp. A-T 12471]MDX6738550.1 ATP-binding protein [Actinocorallia sp. A-T 12471]
MLLSFRTANHRSLYDEGQLLLTPVYPGDDSAQEWEAVPVVGIFGPNASGKSNVLEALIYMSRMVRASFQDSEPGAGVARHPFSLDPASAREPSSFVVDLLLGATDSPDSLFEHKGIRYEYGFSVDGERVAEEWMYSYPHKQRRTIFHRTFDSYEWGTHTAKTMRDVAEIVESNVLFLSVAARSKQTQVRPVYDWFTRVRSRRYGTSSPRRLGSLPDDPDGSYLTWLTGLLRAADTGIEDAEVIEETEEEFDVRLSLMGESARRFARRERTVRFWHRGEHGSFPLAIDDESAGTQSLITLGRPVFLALRAGATLVVDEVDASLHPYVSAHLIRLFQRPETNPRRAQLIFSTHDAALLGRIQGEEVLRRDQVWFTEKDSCGRTELFSLTEFKPRKGENRELRYLAGRYGAVPNVTDELIQAALAQRGVADDVPPDPQT